MTALILSGMDFTNLEKYSLSKWFQLVQMAVKNDISQFNIYSNMAASFMAN